MTTGQQIVAGWKETILKETDGGARIINLLYGSRFGNQIKFRGAITSQFKMRDEHTASARSKWKVNMWITTDYGGDQKSRNPFDLFAFERNMYNTKFSEILKAIASELNITL